jgi:hypothetical protein
MDLSDLYHKRPSLDSWLAAWHDGHAWRGLADEHYAYLRDRANELLQLGEITLETRNRIALAAFNSYLAYVRLNAEATERYAWHYTYQVFEGDQLVATVGPEGHLYSRDRTLLGCISADPLHGLQLTRSVDYVTQVIGTVDGLLITRSDGPPWRLVLSSTPAKRWAAEPTPANYRHTSFAASSSRS